MSLTVSVENVSNVHLPEFPESVEEADCRWSSKNIRGLLYGTVRFTETGRVEEKIEEREEMTPEELDEYAKERVGAESWEAWEEDEDLFGPLETWKQKTTDVSWKDMNYHGSFTFYTSIPRGEETKERYTYEARFTNGDLDEILLLSCQTFEM